MHLRRVLIQILNVKTKTFYEPVTKKHFYQMFWFNLDIPLVGYNYVQLCVSLCILTPPTPNWGCPIFPMSTCDWWYCNLGALFRLLIGSQRWNVKVNQKWWVRKKPLSRYRRQDSCIVALTSILLCPSLCVSLVCLTGSDQSSFRKVNSRERLWIVCGDGATPALIRNEEEFPWNLSSLAAFWKLCAAFICQTLVRHSRGPFIRGA